ncbi:MAG: FAD-dependent oxidoreductase [Neomegalonema sp.]|nr:FAD-dependent oxidoreductase [Neomegalonema sp.]
MCVLKIAVIGSGVSGLGSALALSEVGDVFLFEKDDRFGGHANTAQIDYDGHPMSVDTGFIVFNSKNYPNLCALFEDLNVDSAQSDMSFSMSLDRGRFEYACDSLSKIFAQRWRVLDPRTVLGLRQVLRFHKQSRVALAAGELDHITLGAYLDQHGYSQFFRDRFLYPMGGAIWSTPSDKIGDFPARSFVQFFVNHELLNGLNPGIKWRTVSGGSRNYVRKIVERLGSRARSGVGATEVTRRPDGRVRVAFADGSDALFDQVVLATHSDQALSLLGDATDEERATLSDLRYSDNTAILHRDPRLMPRRERVWSSWNFSALRGGGDQPASVTYWMNRLQNLPKERPLFVSLNPLEEPDPELEFARYSYAHPLFDSAAFAAQQRMESLQGRGGVWYAGAYHGWGFHEDGLKSALRVAYALGARPSWARDYGSPIAPASALAAE